MTKEIIGHGDIAEILQLADNDVLFFASGVSNSRETRESEYQREKDLLLSQDRDKRLVYFSSLGVLDGETRYYDHKREMEGLIKENFEKYCIVRIGNITWGTNPHTLINTLKNRVANEEPVEIKDVFRYVVDPEEFLYWVSLIPDFNCEINIPGTRMKVKEIFNKFV